MPTVLTHPLVASLRTWAPSLPTRVAAAGAALSIVPDLDVAAFALDIPYSHPLGHRGFTHSFVFAFLSSLVATLALHRRPSAFFFLFLCAASHPILDAMTSGGGLGVAFFAPFSNERYFLPWRPIRVSPIGPRFFSARGLAVLASEAVWVWLPLALLALLGKYVVRRNGEAGK